MSSAKVSKLSTILHRLQHDLVFSVGLMQTEFKQTSTSVKVYLTTTLLCVMCKLPLHGLAYM
jgi:hypothetical protein